VVLEERPALEVIGREDTADTLFSCDPAYLHPTHTATRVYGALEMSESDHRELLDLLGRVKGKVMPSGYPSDLYDRALTSWTRQTSSLPNHASIRQLVASGHPLGILSRWPDSPSAAAGSVVTPTGVITSAGVAYSFTGQRVVLTSL
jgi:hypothetical protein